MCTPRIEHNYWPPDCECNGQPIDVFFEARDNWENMSCGLLSLYWDYKSLSVVHTATKIRRELVRISSGPESTDFDRKFPICCGGANTSVLESAYSRPELRRILSRLLSSDVAKQAVYTLMRKAIEMCTSPIADSASKNAQADEPSVREILADMADWRSDIHGDDTVESTDVPDDVCGRPTYVQETIARIREYAGLSYMSDRQIEELYRQWSGESYATWLTVSAPKGIAAFCKWMVTTPMQGIGVPEVHVHYNADEGSRPALADAIARAVLSVGGHIGAPVFTYGHTAAEFRRLRDDARPSAAPEDSGALAYVVLEAPGTSS